MSAKKAIVRVLTITAAVLMFVSIALMCSCKPRVPGNDEPIKLPLEQELTLSMWCVFDDTYMPDYTSYADHPFFKRLKERTNINIDFAVPSVTTITIGNMRDEWMTRIAAGDTTDMVMPFWFVPDHDTTIDEFIEEELYYELTEYVNMQMDNFNALREEYSNIDKLMITPYSNILYIPVITGIDDLNKTAPVTGGLVMRKDFLDELQMSVPVTIDDWHDVLTAFKVQLGVEYPFWLGTMSLAPGCVGDAFISCYGQAYELYLDLDGKVRYGAVEEGTRKYVEMMGQWVSEGLVSTGVDLLRSVKLGDTVGSWGGDINDIANLKAEATNPDYELVACPYPVVTPGDKIDIRASYMPIGNQEINSVYVCCTCESPALACKWIDQLFTEDAYMEASYGEKDVDYTLDADGKVHFTDSILNLDPRSPLYGITQRCYLGSMWADRDVLVNLVYGDNVQEAVKVWSAATSERNIIRSTSVPFTQSDAEALAALGNGGSIWLTQTGTLRGMILDNDISGWDDFVERMRDIGLEEYVQIYQNGWDLYLAM